MWILGLIFGTQASMQQQHTPVSPLVSRVRYAGMNLQELNLERLRMAKALVNKAVKEKKVFSIRGAYPVIRAGLRARGWVERQLPRHHHGDRCIEDGIDSSDDDEKGPTEDKTELNDIHNLMSRLVRNETTYFYWTSKTSSVDYLTLRKDQMTNHYEKAGSFTSKVGLCMNLRNLQWFESADPNTFFPRCYRLGAKDEQLTFIEDFRRTACTSLLLYVVEKSEEVERAARIHTVKPFQGLYKTPRTVISRRVGSDLIDTALHVCQEYLNGLEHRDIDVALEAPPALSEEQWDAFLNNYYLIIHDGVILEGYREYAKCCRSMLNRMQKICPQLETDGHTNMWIIKPGAMSRGRGILCMNRLDEILDLAEGNPCLIKDNKWVVQKYVERPLLILGTKFDVRQWFLVTDWNPLTVWFYQECYLRFSTQPYSTQKLDSSVHLCNNSIQKHFQPSEGRDPSLPTDNMWSCAEFRSWLALSGREHLWFEVVIPGMKRAVVLTLLAAQDCVEHRKASFELYGADFILGPDLHPWLLEVNTSPTMSHSSAITARLCPAVQEDTLRVVLDRRSNRNTHTGGFELLYKQVTVDVPQYLGVNLLVEGTPVRRPCASSCKTTIRSHRHLLHKPRHSVLNNWSPSTKENQSHEKTRVFPTLFSQNGRRLLISQPVLETRRHKPISATPFCPVPSLRDRLLRTSHTLLQRRAVQAYPRRKRVCRNLVPLTHVFPSLEQIRPNPRLFYNR